MDPVSLTTTIVGLLDTARKIKGTLDQVSANRKRLRELSANVVHGIVDLEDLLASASDMDAGNAARLTESLDRLKADLEQVHGRCTKSLSRRRSGRLSGVSAVMTEWLCRGDIEGMIERLERRVHACYLRCQVLISGGIYSALLLHREEHRHNMERIESAFSQMIIHDDHPLHPPKLLVGASGLTPIDWAYLNRQVARVIEAYKRRTPNEDVVYEEPCGDHAEKDPWPLLSWGRTRNMIFNSCLKDACAALNSLAPSSPRTSVRAQDRARALLLLGYHLKHLSLFSAAGPVLEMAASLYAALAAGHPARQYQRCLGIALSSLSCIYCLTPRHASFGERAVEVAQRIYERSGDARDVPLLLDVLQVHCLRLLESGSLDDALDCSKQSVLLSHESCQTQAQTPTPPTSPCTPTVAWRASGESAAVLSTSRAFSCSSYVALHAATALWRLAQSWAGVGRFAAARVAGADAVGCLRAVLQGDAWWAQAGWSDEMWRAEIARWVSIGRWPTGGKESGGFVREVDEEASYATCVMRERRSAA